MKNNLPAFLRATIFLLISLSSVSAFAASNMYLKITDSKGESKTVACADGVCTADNLAAGDYQVVLSDKSGNPVRSSATMEDSVTAPRDAMSGMATGKRMHKPMTLVVELGKSSPQIYQLTIEAPGSQAKIMVTGYDLATNKKM